MADALLCLLAHPVAVAAHVLGQPARAGPILVHLAGVARRGFGILRFRTDRRAAGELGRDLDHRLVDQHRHRVEVRGMGFQAQALGLQRDGTAAGEGVVEGGQLCPDRTVLRPAGAWR